MIKAIVATDTILSIIYILGLVFLFYYSVKICFAKDSKKRIRLFLLTFLTNPFCTFLATVFLMDLSLLLPIFPKDMYRLDSLTKKQVVIVIVILGFVYLLLILLFALWAARFLRVRKKGPVIFVYVIYNTIFVSSERATGDGLLFGVKGLKEFADLGGTLVILLATWLLYRLVIRSLAKMSLEKVALRWGLFIVPPLIILCVYSMYIFSVSYGGVQLGTSFMASTQLFSTIISFLFVWAFYVIIKNINATTEAVKAKDEVKTLSVEVMEALAHTIDAKDEYTKGHSVRVAKYSRMLAEKLGLSAEECENVYYMGLLHDIGKIGVPNAIINSTSKLTDEEYAIIKTHPGLGYDILQEIKSRPDLSIGARWHHERYDGKGYPDGKSGTDIPYLARIIAVADSYDAMTSNRSYRKYLSQDVVRSEIEKNFGKQFDEEVAKCMLSIMDEDVNYELHE